MSDRQSAEDREEAIRKILIALDSSPNSISALQIAADIAAHLDAEMTGLYVEDVNLLRFSGLPFAREVSFYTASVNPVDRQQIELQFRAQANRARRILVEITRRRQLRSNFVVARGLVSTEVLQAAGDADLLVIGRTGWSRRRRLGSTARLVISEAPRHTLILPGGGQLLPPVGVIFDGSAASYRSLAIANSFLRDIQGSLSIVIPAPDIHKARELHAKAEEWVKEHERETTFHWLVGPQLHRLGMFVRSEEIGMLIMPIPFEALAVEDLMALMDEVNKPVLLVR